MDGIFERLAVRAEIALESFEETIQGVSAIVLDTIVDTFKLAIARISIICDEVAEKRDANN